MAGADASILYGLLLALPDALAAIALTRASIWALDVRRFLGLARVAVRPYRRNL